MSIKNRKRDRRSAAAMPFLPPAINADLSISMGDRIEIGHGWRSGVTGKIVTGIISVRPIISGTMAVSPSVTARVEVLPQ